MKSDVAHGIVQIESFILEKLVAEVKETIATDVELLKANKPSTFGAVDLWNIRKGRRKAASFRKSPVMITGLIY